MRKIKELTVLPVVLLALGVCSLFLLLRLQGSLDTYRPLPVSIGPCPPPVPGRRQEDSPALWCSSSSTDSGTTRQGKCPT